MLEPVTDRVFVGLQMDASWPTKVSKASGKEICVISMPLASMPWARDRDELLFRPREVTCIKCFGFIEPYKSLVTVVSVADV